MGRGIAPPHLCLHMKHPDKQAQSELHAIMQDAPTTVGVPGTKKKYKIRGVKPYTIERLTALWIERDMSRPENSTDTLKSLCCDPYFNHKQAALFVLNGFFKIKFLWALLWRWWAYVKGYEEHQLTDIIAEGKKKIPLNGYWMNLLFTLDMRNDWMQMTKKEAEQYRAELLSVSAAHSSKNSHNTEGSKVSS